jgi:formylglycine-generating enzyme required for sulfatase activity
LAKIQARKVKTKEQPPQTASAPPRAVAPFDAAQAKEHQDAWAKHLGVEAEITNSIGMKLRVIPPGEFTMGVTDAEIGELEPLFAAPAVKYVQSAGPAHKVRITRPTALGADEITVGQFAAFVKDTGHVTLAEKQEGAAAPNEIGVGTYQKGVSWKEPGWPQTDDFPVVAVSWHDAVAFCEWLSRKEERQYRLPTEAEWEHACRAGTTTLTGFGPVVNAEQAVFGRGVKGRPEPVGSRAGNAYGIRDMHGNVHEWCLDSYHEKYYHVSQMADPPGPQPCPERVLRGQAFDSPPQRCISAYRFGRAPAYRAITMGFRVTLVDVAPAGSKQ